MQQIEKQCKICGEIKPVDKFYPTGNCNKQGVKYYKGWCKECDREKLRKWRREHFQLFIEYDIV